MTPLKFLPTSTPLRWQLSLSTAILLMFAIPLNVMAILFSNAWSPESKALNRPEFEAQHPTWIALRTPEIIRTPDGTRMFNPSDWAPGIYDTKNKYYSGARLFDFTLRDHDSEWKFVLGILNENPPMHGTYGFLDDNTCVMGFTANDAAKTEYLRIWHRKFPEWWWGHFYRPEVWAAGVLDLILLWKAFPYLLFLLRMKRADSADRSKVEVKTP